MSDLLQGFDMVAAISEVAMNTQVDALFSEHKVIGDTMSIDDKDTGTRLVGTIGSSKGGGPWYSFGVPGNQRAAYFYLPVKTGTLTYWGFEKGKPKPVLQSVDFSDLVYAFQVNLDFVGIEQQAIQNGTNIPPVVKNHLKNFTDEMFTVRALFTDFENANIANYDVSKSTIPGNLKGLKTAFGTLQTLLTDYFKGLAGTKNPYILGYSVEAKNPGRDPKVKPTFVPTGATFSSFLDVSSHDLDALNFLLMTNGVSPPGGGAGMFPANWVEAGSSDGRFVIDSKLIFDDWLLPTIKDSMKLPAPTKSASNSWTFQSKQDDKHTYNDKVDCALVDKVDLHVKTTQQKLVEVNYFSADATDCKIQISGGIGIHQDYTYTCGVDYKRWAEVVQPFQMNVTLTAGTDGQLAVAYEYNPSKQITKKGGNWAAKADDFIFSLLKDLGISVGDWAVSADSNLKDQVATLESSLKSINSKFVMPAGGVFFFKNPEFNAEGDLLVNITYKSN